MMTCKDCKKWKSCESDQKNPSVSFDGDSWANWCPDFDTKHRDQMFEYKGYTVVQSGYNWHVHIYDRNGCFVFHAQSTRRMSTGELEQLVESYIELSKAGSET